MTHVFHEIIAQYFIKEKWWSERQEYILGNVDRISVFDYQILQWGCKNQDNIKNNPVRTEDALFLVALAQNPVFENIATFSQHFYINKLK